MATALLSTAKLNSMHASTQDRIDTLAYHMQDFDIVTFIGTKHKHQPYLQEPFPQRRAGDSSIILEAGHGRGKKIKASGSFLRPIFMIMCKNVE